MHCYLYVSFFVLAWIIAPEYYITIVYIVKTCVKLVIIQLLKKNICNGTKIVLKLYFEKLYIVIVTDMYAVVHA